MSDFSSGITTLEDDYKVNSSCVLKYIFTKIPSEQCYVICCEKTPDKLKDLFNSKTNYLYYDNPRDWIQFSSKCLTNLQAKSTVVIDSINQLSSLTGWNKCFQIIDELKSNDLVKNILIIVHSDCLIYGSKMITSLQYISQTYVLLNSSKLPLRYILNITKKLPGGKVKQYREEVYLDAGESKWVSKEVHKGYSVAVKENVALPEELASFKISVEGPAKAVKDGMVLPYTEVHKPSQVIYHHDAADDWDDEDPDDDLDI